MGIIENRRSIRNFKNTAVDRETIETILQAGLSAPSPKNRQPWHFLIISDEVKKKEMVTAMREEINKKLDEKKERADICESIASINIIEQAPVLILVCYECGMTEQHEDGVHWQIAAKDIEAVELLSIGAAVENMLLKAEELGIGGLWCADILYAYDTVSKYSARPVVSAVCLGYKNEMPMARKKKSIPELCDFL